VRKWTAEQLSAFETGIADVFNQGLIKAPVHLSDGNEEALIDIFENIDEHDWIFCSWRSHYHCLLKGVDPRALETAISAGRSIALSFPESNVYSSAIVGGQIAMAIGAAMSLQKKGSNQRVWCFIGDMTSETGMAQSAIRYAEQFDLPITFIVEDNGYSVLTDTRSVWKSKTLRYEESNSKKVISYKYKNKYPHAGAGVRVQF
jgi:pyruvate dehydrogenase E1 component alpha subunit